MSYAEIEAVIKKALQINDSETMQHNPANNCGNANSGVRSKKEITSPDKKPDERSKQTQFLACDQTEGNKYFRGGVAQPQSFIGGSHLDASPRRRNRRKKRNGSGSVDVVQENFDELNLGSYARPFGIDDAMENSDDISTESVEEPTVKAQERPSFHDVKQEFPFTVAGPHMRTSVSSSQASNVRQYADELKSEYREMENLDVTGRSCQLVEEPVNKANEHVLSSYGSVKQEFPFGVAPLCANSKPSKFSFVGGDETTTSGKLASKTNTDERASVSQGRSDFVRSFPLEPGAKPPERKDNRESGNAKVPGFVVEKSTMEPKVNVTSKNQNSPAPSSTEKMEKELEGNYIFPLKKKSTKFPSAKYFCRLCEYHCDNISHCQQHMKTARHERLLSVLLEENCLRNMVPPSAAHCEAVAKAINDILVKFAITESDQRDRFAVFSKIQQLVKQISNGASAAVYGSTLSLAALKDSDLNIDVTDPNPAKLLKTLYQILREDKSGYFYDVKSDFQSKIPAVLATVSNLNLRVQIGVNNSQSVLTSRLLSVYFQLDKRVRPLVIAFRHWAKVCRIDCQAEGTLPAYVFGLMTVYFLQQCSPPVLPVLHELFSDEIRDSGDIECLLRLDNVQEKWQSSATAFDVGELWIEMLRFYCLELNTTDAVVCIRESKLVKRAEKKWTSKKLAIEDPCSCRRNVARSLSHSQMYEYIDEQLRRAYKYFGIMLDDAFSFDDQRLLPKKGPGRICSICQREGHLKVNCPEETLPPLPRLPSLSRQYIGIFSKVLYEVFEDCRPRERELKLRRNLLEELQSVVRNRYPAAKLCLFGSSCNGFGFQNSDLDISLTFTDHKTAEDLDCVEIIETLTKKLKRHHGFYNVFAITTAKVPIIKFKHSRSQLEGDISLYNTLAQHNTRMLQTYAEIDNRVRILGYNMKVLAKSCDICDASRGSLSSYAYTLMVIYYLQQRKIPVVPVLQELHRGRRPETLVDGWNAWFYEDLKSLPKVWAGYGKNQETFAELWIGLLRFYTEEFNIKEYVVSIRQKEPLTKFEKLWNGNGIAIEDPFNLDHNLGSALSRKMNLYILKVLRHARHVHGTPVNRLDPRYMTMADYLFDARVLTDAPPPNDRGCRRCGKIGHFVNECPLLNRKGRRQEADPDDDEEDASKDEKIESKGNPPLVADKGALDQSKTETTKAMTNQSNVASSADDISSSQCSSSISIPSSTHHAPASSQSDKLGGSGGSSSSSNLLTKPPSPLLNGPLVFHNSKISPMNAAIPSTEVLLGSQVHGGSYLFPTLLQPVVPFVQQPAAMAVPNSVMNQWVAANLNQTNQPSLSPGTSAAASLPTARAQLPNTASLPGCPAPANSEVNATKRPVQAQHLPPQIPYPLFNLPFYQLPGGNPMNMTQGGYGQLGINNNHQVSVGAKDQSMYMLQHGHGQRQTPNDPGLVGQPHLLMPMPMDGKVQGLPQQTDMHKQVQGHGPVQVQGYHVHSLEKGLQLQNQTQQFMIPTAADVRSQSHHQGLPSAEAQIPLTMENLFSRAANADQDLLKNSQGNPLLNPASFNQFQGFPVGAFDHSSAHLPSAFTPMMATQIYQQRYQELLQASLLQALGIKSNNNMAPVPQSLDLVTTSAEPQFSATTPAPGANSLRERSVDPLESLSGSQHVLAGRKLDDSQKGPVVK